MDILKDLYCARPGLPSPAISLLEIHPLSLTMRVTLLTSYVAIVVCIYVRLRFNVYESSPPPKTQKWTWITSSPVTTATMPFTNDRPSVGACLCLLSGRKLAFKLSCCNSNISLTAITLLVLMLSGDIEINPGPRAHTIYPCGFCEIAVPFAVMNVVFGSTSLVYRCVS